MKQNNAELQHSKFIETAIILIQARLEVEMGEEALAYSKVAPISDVLNLINPYVLPQEREGLIDEEYSRELLLKIIEAGDLPDVQEQIKEQALEKIFIPSSVEEITSEALREYPVQAIALLYKEGETRNEAYARFCDEVSSLRDAYPF